VCNARGTSRKKMTSFLIIIQNIACVNVISKPILYIEALSDIRSKVLGTFKSKKSVSSNFNYKKAYRHLRIAIYGVQLKDGLRVSLRRGILLHSL
jgi:hypothetical protein